MYVSKIYTEKAGTLDRKDYRRYKARRRTGRCPVSRFPVASSVIALVDSADGSLEAEGLDGAVETGIGFGEGADSCHD